MSVVGIDFGNESVVIAQAQRGGIDIILNESSNRKNPCMVSFQGKQRFMGEGALSIARSNYRNTVREVKRLIGRKWRESDLQQDLARLPFTVKENPKTGGVLVEVIYNDESTLLMPEQVMAMMLVKAMDIAKAGNADVPVADAVLSIPGWFTDSMRHSVLDACRIAGLNTMRLMHETTATALAYGIYKSAKGMFSATEPQYVLFLDLGHSTFSASVATFTQEALVVKSAAYDRNLGGRDFDWAIAQHLAEAFKAKHKVDPRTSPKALLKLLDAAERAKKNLSPIGVKDCVVNIECLWEETDFNTRLSLEDFQALIQPLLARLVAPVEQALREAGITADKLSAVEVVGGGTRVPDVKRKFAELVGADQSALNFGLSCTLNADESVARGCALQCAILSSRFRVKEFGIIDIVPYPIRVSWEGAAGDPGVGGSASDEVMGTAEENTTVLFAKNDDTPKTRRITFRRAEPFSIAATYDAAAELPDGAETSIGEFRVLLGAAAPAAGVSKEPPRVRVNLRHDINGVLGVTSAQMMEEIVDGTEEGDAAASPAGKDVKEAEAKMEVDGEGAAAEGAEGDAAAAPDAAAGAAPKKKFRKVNVDVESMLAALAKVEIDAAIEAETKMASQDRILRETADKRNELESYIYRMRDKMLDELKPYATEDAATQFSASLSSAEDWLYSDEGFEGTKTTFSEKLASLHALGDPIEQRRFEADNRGQATAELTSAIETYKRLANSMDEAYAHIEEAERSKVREAAASAETWLFDKLDKQGSLPVTADPVLLVGDVRARTQNMSAVCKPIMNKPKPAAAPAPAPSKPEEKPTAPTGSAGEPSADKEEAPAPMEAEDASAVPAADGPTDMETEEK